MKNREKKLVFKGGPGISKKQEAALMMQFALGHTAADATVVARVFRHTAERYFRIWREVIYAASARAPRFSGEVEMDQKQFGGRGRKRMDSLLKRYKKILTYSEYQTKAKVIRAQHKTKVFGIMQRDTQQIYLKIIKREDKRTLEPVVFTVVEGGATIFTDKWRGFADLGIHGYTHHSINHSVEYVDIHGHHANTIESFWSFAQLHIDSFRGVRTTVLPVYLKECEWRWNIGAHYRHSTDDRDKTRKAKVIVAKLKQLL